VEGTVVTTILAVYEGGVLRPVEPLSLPEGQAVQLTVYPRPPFLPLRPATPEEEDYARRLKAASTLEEMFAVMAAAPPTTSPDEWERQIRTAKTMQEWVALANACPDTEPDFDIVKAINETRRLTGFRVPDPEPTKDGPV
jgi:predicted DNA-binding antitoxin AbrB/MazE fold protein